MRRARVSHRVCVCSYRPAPIHSPRTTTMALDQLSLLHLHWSLPYTVPHKESVERDKSVCGRRLPPLPKAAPSTLTRLRVNKLELEMDSDSHWPGLPSHCDAHSGRYWYPARISEKIPRLRLPVQCTA